MSPRKREKRKWCQLATVYSSPCGPLALCDQAPCDYRTMCVILFSRFRFYFRDGFGVMSRRTTVFCRSIAKFRLHDLCAGSVCCWPRRTARSRCPNELSCSFGFQSEYQFSTSDADRPLNERTDGEDCVAGQRFDRRKSDTRSRQTVSAHADWLAGETGETKTLVSHCRTVRDSVGSSRSLRFDRQTHDGTQPTIDGRRVVRYRTAVTVRRRGELVPRPSRADGE